MTDRCQYAPATVRNRDFILDVLRDVLPMTGVILEIASGSGEHVVYFARNFPSLVFQPSDPEPEALLSVAAGESRTGHKCARADCAGRLAITLAKIYRSWPRPISIGPTFHLRAPSVRFIALAIVVTGIRAFECDLSSFTSSFHQDCGALSFSSSARKISMIGARTPEAAGQTLNAGHKYPAGSD
jgi:hypothetical protein